MSKAEEILSKNWVKHFNSTVLDSEFVDKVIIASMVEYSDEMIKKIAPIGVETFHPDSGITTYPEMNAKVVGYLRMRGTVIDFYAAQRIIELEEQIKELNNEKQRHES